MQGLVVFESMFGNTREVARAVGSGLFTFMDVEVVEVGTATQRIGAEVDLLVVGGPTHAFGMSRPNTRRDALKQTDTPLVSRGIGIREWLGRLEVVRSDLPAATFDTRVNMPRVPRSAARAVHKHLSRLGCEMVAPSQSFWVTGMTGPLVALETARAKEWGEQLGRAMAERRRPRWGMRV